MRRVLYISYHFPPVGGAGVQRALKFTRYLPELGFLPTVVTCPEAASGRWTPVDETMGNEIPPEVHVLRVPGHEPSMGAAWRSRSERWLRRSSEWKRWWVEGAVATGSAVTDADVLLCSMSPFESAEAAVRLSSELNIPWVADLRDPWALDEMMTYPSRVHRHLELGLMRRSLATANTVIMNTPTAAALLRERFPEFLNTNVVAITNGYDAADFSGVEPKRKDNAFRIVHTGYLHTDAGLDHRRLHRRLLGAAAPDVDILTRSHVYLVAALDLLAESDPDSASKVELHLAGVLSEKDRISIGTHPAVRLHGYVSHDDAIALVRSADLLFLPMHNLPRSRRATIVPGKTYEYLASGRPILAAIPDGDARDILNEAGGAFLCRPDEVPEMARVIEGLVRSTASPPVRNTSVVARYERRELARKLASTLAEASGDPASLPDSALSSTA